MKLPVVSGSEAVRAFRKVGYEFDEQHGYRIAPVIGSRLLMLSNPRGVLKFGSPVSTPRGLPTLRSQRSTR